jgi:hypothetical protein
MTLLERWKAVAWDIRLGCGAAVAFTFWFALGVLEGPNLILMASWCLTLPLLAAVALVIAIRLAVCPPRGRRALLLALVAGCLATAFVVRPDDMVDLHLVARIYMAGGPRTVNAWAQELIREQEGKGESRHLERDELPPNIRENLPGWTSVGGTLWSDTTQVRIELGGGFYHYGVVVYPTGTACSAEWWQNAVGWPPELVVYHEN